MNVSFVREIHNLTLIDLPEGGTQASLHLKLPGELPLDRAHAIAEEVERAIRSAVPEIADVQTHLEPLAERASGTVGDDAALRVTIERAVVAAAGRPPRLTRVLDTPDGLVVLLTIPVAGHVSLTAAHDEATEVAERVREAVPGIADVTVHTEP
jgi:divalent metal cation (Fe/Co/Zn/Cd) transporter